MTDTTRDLIQRLADALAEWQLGGAPPEDTSDADLINEAHAYLSQPEPEGLTLDCDDIDVPPWYHGDDFYVYKEGYDAGWSDAALAADRARWGRPAVEPVPEGATDEQIEKSFQLWWFNEGSGMRPSNGEDQEEHVRRVSQIAWSNGAYVARWGRPAVKPVPVSERPWEREGWCDNNGWCWGFDADGTDECWSFDRPEAWVCWTHVLPHYALPIPTTTQEDN